MSLVHPTARSSTNAFESQDSSSFRFDFGRQWNRHLVEEGMQGRKDDAIFKKIQPTLLLKCGQDGRLIEVTVFMLNTLQRIDHQFLFPYAIAKTFVRLCGVCVHVPVNFFLGCANDSGDSIASHVNVNSFFGFHSYLRYKNVLAQWGRDVKVS